jgi:hypothetical protein
MKVLLTLLALLLPHLPAAAHERHVAPPVPGLEPYQHDSEHGPQLLWGPKEARIRNRTFENLSLGGKPVTDSSFFQTQACIENLVFRKPSPHD